MAIARFLDGKLSLDQAFGLVRSRPGNPGVPVEVQVRMALAVWEQYLPGKDPLEAVATRVGDELGKGKKQVLKYFYDNFLASYTSFVLVHRRPKRRNTPHENRRFRKLNRYHEEREIRLACALGARSRP